MCCPHPHSPSITLDPLLVFLLDPTLPLVPWPWLAPPLLPDSFKLINQVCTVQVISGLPCVVLIPIAPPLEQVLGLSIATNPLVDHLLHAEFFLDRLGGHAGLAGRTF